MSTTNIQGYIPTKNQVFILDTNVLIKLFYPSLSTTNTIPYENLYANILAKKASIIVSSIQISEYVNRCIRFQYDLWKTEQEKNTNLDFKKDYRNTQDYKNSMNAILNIITNDISTTATYIDDQFSKMDRSKLYQYGFSYDFNDAIVAEIARLNKAILVTDDRDFGNYSSSIDIVTGNPALLMFGRH